MFEYLYFTVYEAKMTLLKFKVSKTNGFDVKTSEKLKLIRSFDLSSTVTSEKETSLIRLPEIAVPEVDGGEMAGIELQANGKLQDYTGKALQDV